MRIILDTHCWLWWIAEPERLRDSARLVIADRNNEIYLSAASSWEIAIKYSLGKLALPEPPEDFVPKRLARDAVFPLPVQHVHVLHVSTLPQYHKDPFDRLIISQSLIEHIPIMTVDRQFESYDVKILWGD
ncbi:MAG: type II toxin-antitoxin system VapC family toxin [Desulfobacteraceae bacterium]|jgi:PIN domain nuclease of toxin-antitoxin system|nr:MAG: type II toxin-antitoxin system VapC family toxin [Desulfobacteraceae bacterium]